MVVRAEGSNRRQLGTPEEVIVSKKINIDEKTYNVDLKENARGVFVRITEFGSIRSQSIIIDIDYLDNFIDRLAEMAEFSFEDSEDPKKEEGQKDLTKTLKSSMLFVKGRRFYFDVRDHADGSRNLRISFVSRERRTSIHIVHEALDSFIPILLDIQSHVPKREPKKRTQQVVRKEVTEDRVHVNSQRNQVKKNFRSNKFERRERPERIDRPALTILQEPGPHDHVVGNKAYRFEVVEGSEKAFLRISERIGNNRRQPLHIPLEGVTEWKKTLADFVDSIPEEIIDNAEKNARELQEKEELQV